MTVDKAFVLSTTINSKLLKAELGRLLWLPVCRLGFHGRLRQRCRLCKWPVWLPTVRIHYSARLSRGTSGYVYCITGALPRLDSSAGNVRCGPTSRFLLCGRMSTKELLSRCSASRPRIPVISSSGFRSISNARRRCRT